MTSEVWKAMKGVQFVLIAYVISIAAFGYAYNANSVALREAKARADDFEREANARAAQFEDQNKRLRFAFCGLQPYAAITTPAPTEAGQTLRQVMKNATGPDGLACTPDPTDGQ